MKTINKKFLSGVGIFLGIYAAFIWHYSDHGAQPSIFASFNNFLIVFPLAILTIVKLDFSDIFAGLFFTVYFYLTFYFYISLKESLQKNKTIILCISVLLLVLVHSLAAIANALALELGSSHVQSWFSFLNHKGS